MNKKTPTTNPSDNRCPKLEVISVTTCQDLTRDFGRPKRLNRNFGVWERDSGSAIIYHRQARADGPVAGAAIDALRKQAREVGLSVRGVVVAVGAGAGKSRPDLEALRALLEERGAGEKRQLFVRDLERLARDRTALLQFVDRVREAGVELYVAGRPLDLSSPSFADFAAAVLSEHYRRCMSERIRHGLQR